MKISSFLFIALFTSFSMAKFLPLRLEQTAHSVSGHSPTAPILMLLFIVTLFIGKLFILYPYQQASFTQKMLNNSKLSPKETAFVFDLHGVVFRFSPIRAIKQALTTKQKKKLFCAITNPFLIWDVLKLIYNSSVVEEAIMGLSQQHPSLEELIPLALKMANEQIPIEPTVKLLRQIKKSGFKIFVFSNIGEHSAQILKGKYPEIFELFDGVLVTTANDNYLMKPSEKAFIKFLNKFNIEKEQIIFIDDKQSNVHIARKMGIPAIQFINPHQCGQQLQKIVPLHN